MIQHHPDDTPVKTRLYVEESLSQGATVGLDHERTHYLRHVLRLERGDRVALFNGRDGEWSARIDGFGKGWCSLAVEGQAPRPGGASRMSGCCSPRSSGRGSISWRRRRRSLALRAIWPVITRHTIVARVNTDRLRANAIEAAEQCERLTIRKSANRSRWIRRWPAGTRSAGCCSAPKPVQCGRSRRLLARPSTRGRTAMLTGPEGGFAKDELDALHKLPFVVPVGLGPRILRADTAALAALAIWQAHCGDWSTTVLEIVAAVPFPKPG